MSVLLAIVDRCWLVLNDVRIAWRTPTVRRCPKQPTGVRSPRRRQQPSAHRPRASVTVARSEGQGFARSHPEPRAGSSDTTSRRSRHRHSAKLPSMVRMARTDPCVKRVRRYARRGDGLEAPTRGVSFLRQDPDGHRHQQRYRHSLCWPCPGLQRFRLERGRHPPTMPVVVKSSGVFLVIILSTEGLRDARNLTVRDLVAG